MDVLCNKVQNNQIQSKARDLLRLVICGSVDDGKSTLIGRLLYDADLIAEDHRLALIRDSKKNGFAEGCDYSLLMDGLAAEREQKITIDIAWRYFATAKRHFVVADAPGHVQYTPNMVTAASTADLALILVDVQKGMLVQTRRHTMIAALMGIRQVIFVINKMDQVVYKQAAFMPLAEACIDYAKALGIPDCSAIPVSALEGENIIKASPRLPWYKSLPLMTCLENCDPAVNDRQKPFRMAVQWVNRPNADFRGFSGQIVSGSIRPGDVVKILPADQKACIARIVTYDGDLPEAKVGESVTLTFTEAVDASRGDIIALAENPCKVADQLEADLLWMSQQSMIAGRQYSLRIANNYLFCSLARPDFVTDIDTLTRLHSPVIDYNQIGRCTLLLDRLIAFDRYTETRRLGCLLVIDKRSQEILAAGVIREGMRRAEHIPCQSFSITPLMRAAMKLQKPAVIWFTGLSGAGKTTLANLLEKKLQGLGRHTMLLDANNMRHGLNKDLGFSETDRVENTRRIAEVAKLMFDAGLITLVACIAPFAAERKRSGNLIGEEHYIEVFVDAPLAVVEARDPGGLYAKVRAGKIKEFTGISAIYETPETPDIHVDTVNLSPESAVQLILDWLTVRKYL